MFKNNPLFFINFSFFEHTIIAFEKLCFAENSIKIVFQKKKHSFSKTQLVKPNFSPMSTKTPFSKKRCHFWFWAISAENHYFFSFSWFALFWSKLAKTDSVHENAFFSLPDTNSVRQFLLKILFLLFHIFG